MATGIIGALAGITGAVLGVVGYLRTARVKELELRLELRKSASKAGADLQTLKELMPHVYRSHRHVAAAIGTMNSGAMTIWEEGYREDMNALSTLLEKAPELGDEFLDLDSNALESKLAGVYKLQLQIQKLTDKYNATLAADDAERLRIKDRIDRQTRF